MINGEKHHIKPKSLFPELINEESNIVKLTYKEHYVCHHLLYKIYEEKNDRIAMIKMASAWLRMCKNKDGQHVTLNQYETAKKSVIDARSGVKRSDEVIKKIKEKMKGFHHTEESKKKISEHSALKGKHRSDEVKAKIRAKQLGKKMSAEAIEKSRQSHLGKVPWNRGKINFLDGYKWWNNGEINTRAKECPRRRVGARKNEI